MMAGLKSSSRKKQVRPENKESSTDNQEQFNHEVNCINDWLISSESNLKEMVTEQIAADPVNLQKQIDRLTAFSQDVVNHSEKIEVVDAAGDLLAEDSTDMITQIDATIFDIHTRYNCLLLSIDDRLQQLLVEIVNHSTDDCVCDQMPSQDNSERDYVLHKDMAVKIKKEPLQEDDQKYKQHQHQVVRYQNSGGHLNKQTSHEDDHRFEETDSGWSEGDSSCEDDGDVCQEIKSKIYGGCVPRQVKHRDRLMGNLQSSRHEKQTRPENIPSQKLYNHMRDYVDDWLTSSESNLNEMTREQIAAVKAEVQEQIDRLMTFCDDVVKHFENIELLDATGALLGEVSPDMTVQIKRATTVVHTRYHGLLLSIDSRLQQQHSALIQHSIDDCVCDPMSNCQDNGERDYLPDKDMAIKPEKEPLQEGEQEYKAYKEPSQQEQCDGIYPKMELHEKGIKIQDLSDWLVHVEQSLASEQPLKEKSVEVKEQKVIRKLLHEDIQVHQQPVRQCVEDIEQFLKILRHRGSHPDTNHLRLRDGQSDLRGRYDAVLTQSSNRQKTLTRAIEDLQRLEVDFKEFQDWLQGAERKMDTMEGNVTIQLDPLNAQEAHHKEFGEDIKDQKGHLQFLKKSVQTYTNLAKIYSQSLDEFRIRVPLQNSRAFQETPETHLLVGQLRDVIYRFDKLRVRYLKHVRLFEEFVAKDTFSEKVSSASTWLGDARTTLKDMRSEPIVAAKEVILRQIERLVMFHQDVITHASDIQNVKTNYKDLIISQPAVQRTIDDIVESIRILKADAEDFLEKLQIALSNTQLVNEKLDKLITWLDEVEEQHRLEKGALTSFRRETILEGIENNENLHKYISTHRDDIDAINDVAFKLYHIIEPQKAKTIRDKLSEVNNRYQNICDATIRHRNMLRGLVDGVNDFESRVNRLEDWELQLIQTLSSKGTEQLEDAKQQVERQRPALKHILHIGEQLIKEPGFNDLSHFKDILANVKLNWETLEDSLAQRMEQVNDLQTASQKYDGQPRETACSLEGKERRVDQTCRDMRDKAAMEPFLQEVDNYKHQITALKRTRGSLNAFKTVLAQLLTGKLFSRSIQLVTGTVHASGVESELCAFASLGGTEMHVAEHCHQGKDNAELTFDMVETTQVKIDRCKPKTEPLKKDIKVYQTRINILLRKQLAVVRDLLDWVTEMEQALGSEQFQFDQKGRLHEHVVHHKILQQTIQSRHQEVESNTKDVLQFMKQCGSCISPEDVTKVRAGIEDLQIRSDVVLMQSYIRTNKLETALDVVKELDTSTDKIEVLQEKLEERMDALETNIGQDYATLTVQLDEHHRITEDINDQRLKCELIDKLGEAYQYQAKAYQDILADFRTAVLPHMSESNFRKSPEPDVIGTRIFSINSRMDRLKMSAVALGERLKALVSSHENYDQTVEGFNKWCGEVEGNLAALEKEAVATEPVSIMKQIDQVKNFNDGVVSHGRDLEWIKMTEAKLVDAQGALELEVNSNTNRSTTRYQAILVRIDDFFRRLKGALTNIPSFPGSLDALLRSIQQGHALIKQKLSTQLNAHQPTHPISELGKNDTQTKVRDTSLLSAVLANVSKNLKDLKDLLWTRSLAERNEDPSKSSGKECIPETVKKKRKLQDGNSFATLLIFLATVSLASASNQHQLTSGSPGNVTFDAPWTSRDGLFPYYTIRFESQRSPFCTMTRLHDGGFKSQQQYERFKVSYTLADDMIHVTVEISDVSEEDADVYTLTLTSFGDGSDSNTRVVKEIKICHPLGKAQCGILEAAEGYSKMYADVACRARVGNENSTLACYQHGTKIPYKGGIHNDGHHVHGRFWMKINKSPVYCCSHDYNTQTDQSTCNDFVWPRPTTSTTLNSLVTMPGQALSISTSNNAREFPGETYNSSCDLHAHISFLYLLLGISLYVVMQ